MDVCMYVCFLLQVLVDPVRLVVGVRNAGASTIDQQLLFVGQEEGKLQVRLLSSVRIIYCAHACSVLLCGGGVSTDGSTSTVRCRNTTTTTATRSSPPYTHPIPTLYPP